MDAGRFPKGTCPNDIGWGSLERNPVPSSNAAGVAVIDIGLETFLLFASSLLLNVLLYRVIVSER